MYTQKEINDVLKIYDRLNSLRGTVRLLGYPSRPKPREWLRERRETGVRSVLSLACEEITSHGKRLPKPTFKAVVACKQRSINWATTFLNGLFRIGSKSFIRKRESSITALSSSTLSVLLGWDEGTKNGPDRSALLGHNFVYQETKSHGFYSSYFHQRISS